MAILVQDNIEFHNVAALETVAGVPGLLMARYPRAVRESLACQDEPGAKAARVSQESTGCEMRFVSSCPHMTQVFLSSPFYDTQVQVFCGDCFHSEIPLPAGRLTALELSPPGQFRDVAPTAFEGRRFAPDVWRLVLNRAPVFYHAVEANGCAVRPPRPDEKPRLRWLAYGSSITHSSWKGYPSQAACRLGVDVLNKGLAGACHCQQEVADHLADGEKWDFATLELGINMRGSFEPTVFRRRAAALIDRLIGCGPERPIVLVTLLPNYTTHFENRTRQEFVREEAFNAVLRDLARAHSSGKVLLVEGSEILPSLGLLTTDLLHPSEFGHGCIAEHLARALHRLLPGLFTGSVEPARDRLQKADA